jgi:DUF438 domain-containing protein
MGIKNKITGVMIDLIVERKQDRTFNYTYQDIQKELLEKFDKGVSINSIRLRYLKAIQQPSVNTVVQAVQPQIEQKETVIAVQPQPVIHNGLKAKVVSEADRQALLDELKNF